MKDKLQRKRNCPTISNYIFLGSHKPYSKSNQIQQDFLEDLILYITKGYHLLSSIENSWLKHLVLCQHGHAQFPFKKKLVNEVILNIMTKPRKNMFSKLLFIVLHVKPLLIFACHMLVTIIHYVVNFITISWEPTQVTIGVFEV
jgi:hypothetical protein